MTSYTKTELIHLGIIDAEIDEDYTADNMPEGNFAGDDEVVYKILSEPTDAEISHQLAMMQLDAQKSIDNKLQFFKTLAIIFIVLSIIGGFIALIAACR